MRTRAAWESGSTTPRSISSTVAGNYLPNDVTYDDLHLISQKVMFESPTVLSWFDDAGYRRLVLPAAGWSGWTCGQPDSICLSGGPLHVEDDLVYSVTLLGPAWQAAWNGTRALWYSSEVGRAEMVSTDDLPERYEYFRGMRITPALHESLERLNQLQNELNGRGQASGEFYFLNGTEFLLRAFPGKRFAGLPLWLHEGTTYGEKGARLIQQKLASADIRGVVSFGGWNRWYHGMEWYLDARYQYERVGPVLHVYRERGDPRHRRSCRRAMSSAAAVRSTR